MKTFEELWNEAEPLATEVLQTNTYINLMDNISKQNYILQNLALMANSPIEFNEPIGRLLFAIAAVSGHFNINIYEELQKVMEDEKTNLLEAQLGGNVDELKE